MKQARVFHKPTPKQYTARESHSDRATKERTEFKQGKLPSFKTMAGRIK